MISAALFAGCSQESESVASSTQTILGSYSESSTASDGKSEAETEKSGKSKGSKAVSESESKKTQDEKKSDKPAEKSKKSSDGKSKAAKSKITEKSTTKSTTKSKNKASKAKSSGKSSSPKKSESQNAKDGSEAASQTSTTTATAKQKQTTKSSANEATKAETKNTQAAQKITSTTSSELVCSIEIECKSILDNKSELKKGHEEYVPSNGIILDTYSVEIPKSSTAYDLLSKAAKDKSITLNVESTMYGKYVAGINNIDEFDCGKQSGWLYSVNGKYPNVSCDSYTLKNGDKVVFSYTCSY